MNQQLGSVTIDERGRITLPQPLRKRLGLEKGDSLMIHTEGKVVELIRLEHDENPFAVLAKHAIKEHRKGNTISLEEVARKRGFNLDE
jgi:AbrB family looped-hinge helix DNA binding protein